MNFEGVFKTRNFSGGFDSTYPQKFMTIGLLRVDLSQPPPQVQIPITFGGYFKTTTPKIPIIMPFGGDIKTTTPKSQIIITFGGRFERTATNSSFIITFGGG